MAATPTGTLNDPTIVDPSLNITALVTGLPKMELNLKRDMAGIIAQSVLYGVHILVFGLAMFTILRKRRSRIATQLIGITTVLMFLISTFLWSSAIWTLFFRMHKAIGERSPVNMSERVKEANLRTAKVRYASDMLFIISFLLGDAVIGWRILILWQWHIVATVILGILYLGAFTTGWGLIGCLIHADFPLTASVPALCTDFSNISWLLSVAFNIAATALLARLAWQHRRTNRMVDKRKRTNVDRVLLFLVVAGVVYIILSAPRLSSFHNKSLQPTPSSFTTATQTIEQILYQLVNLYPTAVTAILSYFTHLDESQKSADSTVAHGGVRTGTSLFNSSRRTPVSGTAVVMMGSGKHAMEDRSVDDVSLGPLGGPEFKRGYGRGARDSHDNEAGPMSMSRYSTSDDGYQGGHHSRQRSYGQGHAI